VSADLSHRTGESSGAAAEPLLKKGPALLPPYTTGIVRIRSNLDMNLGRRVAMASCRSKVRLAVRSLVKRRERIRRRVRRVSASIVRA
jgi:hypothetical protein